MDSGPAPESIFSSLTAVFRSTPLLREFVMRKYRDLRNYPSFCVVTQIGNLLETGIGNPGPSEPVLLNPA